MLVFFLTFIIYSMKIYLLDINPLMVDEWSKLFKKDVNVVCDDFKHFMDHHHNIDCIVSPANSQGIMNGGYDLAISLYFGWQLTKNVQKYIKDNCHGYQDVATSLMFDIPNSNIKLIHTPTMLYPSRIDDVTIIYKCMYNTLKLAIAKNIKAIVIPAFGGLTGQLDPSIIAQQMYKAYKDITK